MKFTFTVEIEVDRVEGKFAARDEIAEELLNEIEGNAPTEVYGVGADGDSTYEVTDYSVTEVDGKKP